MKIKTAKELLLYSKEDLIQLFEVNYVDSNNIINSLINKKILKKSNNNLNKNNSEELIEQEHDFENIFDLEIKFTFDYVGVLIIKSVCVFVYPKYISNITNDYEYAKFQQILEVIKRYKARKEHSYQFLLNDGEDNNFNFLTFTLDFLRSYHEHGLYFNDVNIIEENGFGEIFWNKTINEKQTYLVKNRPIYLEYLNFNNNTSKDDFFRKMQKVILTITTTKMEEILKIFGFEKVNLTNLDLDSLGNTDYLKYKINNEKNAQFITWKLQLLNQMEQYIIQDQLKSGSDSISFYGTTNFNMVWEDVCQVVKNDLREKTLTQLNLKSFGNANQNDRLKDVIKKPTWKNKYSGSTYSVANQGAAIPDLINIFNKELKIYDAKYYLTYLDENNVIQNSPGTNDIMKQHLYELAYSKFAKENNLTIVKNAFLIPSDQDFEISLANISVDFMKNHYLEQDLNDIEVILLPCVATYEKYLKKS